MRVPPPMLAGFVAVAAVTAQAAPDPREENWLPLGSPLSFAFGDQACREGLQHQALWRDWRGDWWLSPCVADR